MSSVSSQVSSFVTQLGSSYVVHADGTTTRTKAKRPGHSDYGLMERSEKTYYISRENANRLAPPNKWRILDHQDGSLSLAAPSKEGWAIAPSGRKVPIETTPQIGLLPLELWLPETILGTRAYKKVHFGSQICELK